MLTIEVKDPLNDLIAAANQLLQNSYPHDLVAIRLAADNYSSEEAFKACAEIYCTQTFLDQAMQRHNEARARLVSILGPICAVSMVEL